MEQMKKPVVTKGKGTHVADVNDNKDFALDARNAQINNVAQALTDAQIDVTLCEDEENRGELFLQVGKEDSGLYLLNEFKYNAAIKKEEWKIHVVKDGTYKSHFKASNITGIIKSVEKLLAAE